jgi:hypothetical protein
MMALVAVKPRQQLALWSFRLDGMTLALPVTNSFWRRPGSGSGEDFGPAEILLDQRTSYISTRAMPVSPLAPETCAV